MLTPLITGFSILFQLLAILLTLRMSLVYLPRRRLAGLLVASALVALTLHALLPLVDALTGGAAAIDPREETLSLLIAVLWVAGIRSIAPLLAGAKPAEDTLPVLPAPAAGDEGLESPHLSERKLAEIELRAGELRQQEMLKIIADDHNRRTGELEAITTLSAALRQAQTLPELMTLLLEHTVALLGAQAGGFGLVNGNSLVIQKATGQAQGWQGNALPQDHSLFWEVVRTGNQVIIHPPGHENFSGGFAPLEVASSGIVTGIFTPLKNGAVTIGLLCIGYTRNIVISEPQKRLAAAISDIAGNALHRMSIADALEKLVVERTRDLDTIYTVTAAASRPGDLQATLTSALELILTASNAQTGAIFLVEEPSQNVAVLAQTGAAFPLLAPTGVAKPATGLEHWVLTHKQPLILADLTADHRVDLVEKTGGVLPFTALPMRVGERVVGVLELARTGERLFDPHDVMVLSFIADHLGLIIENAHLLEQAEIHAVHTERLRLARELHDSVTQLLYSATLFAEGGRRFANLGNLPAVQDSLAKLGEVTQQALREMRLMVFELRSSAMHSVGLARALQLRLDAVENRAGITATLEVGSLPKLPEMLEEGIYRIALEALNNSLKHAHARNILVSLDARDEKIILCVADDGRGFDPATGWLGGGMGLSNMRERAERLQGTLKVESVPGSGTEVIAEFQLSVAENPSPHPFHPLPL